MRKSMEDLLLVKNRNRLYSMRPDDWQTKGLKDLIGHLKSDSEILEIGVYSGESTLIFMESNKIRKLTAIDPWNMLGIGKTCETVFYERLEGHLDKIEVIKDFSETALPKIENNSLDFIYIDASHTYEDVRKDILLSIPKIKDGGMIGGHDYKWVPDPEEKGDYSKKGVQKAVKEIFKEKNLILFDDSSWLIKDIKKSLL